jgi:hypothetical protein
MKPSIYIKKHMLGDIVLLLVISSLTYMLFGLWNDNNLKDETTVELIPINANSDEELG